MNTNEDGLKCTHSRIEEDPIFLQASLRLSTRPTRGAINGKRTAGVTNDRHECDRTLDPRRLSFFRGHLAVPQGQWAMPNRSGSAPPWRACRERATTAASPPSYSRMILMSSGSS